MTIKNNEYDHNRINKIGKLLNEIIILIKKITRLAKKNTSDIVFFLLLNTNVHSYGFIFINWLKISKNEIADLKNRNEVLKKIIDIVVNCYVSFIIDKDNIFLLDRNYINLKKILNL